VRIFIGRFRRSCRVILARISTRQTLLLYSVDKRFCQLTISACPCRDAHFDFSSTVGRIDVDITSYFTTQLYRARASSVAAPFRERDVARSSSASSPVADNESSFFSRNRPPRPCLLSSVIMMSEIPPRMMHHRRDVSSFVTVGHACG